MVNPIFFTAAKYITLFKFFLIIICISISTQHIIPGKQKGSQVHKCCPWNSIIKYFTICSFFACASFVSSFDQESRENGENDFDSKIINVKVSGQLGTMPVGK